MTTPSMFGSEWDESELVYVLFHRNVHMGLPDRGGSIKVGKTAKAKARMKKHSKDDYFPVVELCVKRGTEAKFHKHNKPHLVDVPCDLPAGYRNELYYPTTGLVENLERLVVPAERDGLTTWRNGWDYNRFSDVVDAMHQQWMIRYFDYDPFGDAL